MLKLIRDCVNRNLTLQQTIMEIKDEPALQCRPLSEIHNYYLQIKNGEL